jgi:hypothetical protein
MYDLKAEDYIFLFFFGIILTIIISGFIRMPRNGYETITKFIETFVLVMLFFVPIYIYLKSKSGTDMSYLTQDRLYMMMFVVILVLVAIIVGGNIYRDRKKPGGFIIFVVAIIFIIIAILLLAANSALTTRYNLNSPNLETMIYMSGFKR